MNKGFIKIISIGFLLIFSFLGYTYQSIYPTCCDAVHYFNLANNAVYRDKFILFDTSGFRTYGIQVIYSLIIRLANFFSINHRLLIFIIQVSLYLIMVLLLKKQLSSISNKVSDITFFALIFNILLYPYLSITLTEAMSMIFFLLVVNLFVFSYNMFLKKGEFKNNGVLSISIKSVFTDIFINLLFGIILGYLIMIRPANIYMLLILFPFLWINIYKNNTYSNWFSYFYTAIRITLIAIGFLISIYPQLSFNKSYFNSNSFFPAIKLGNFQLEAGKHYLKYQTLVDISGVGRPLYYTNPLFLEQKDITYSEQSKLPKKTILRWYFENPKEGTATIFLHIFALFDFDYLFPYIHVSQNEGLVFVRIFTFLYSHFVVFWFIVGIIALIRKKFLRKNTFNISNDSSIYIVVSLLLLLGSISIHSFSAVENRFALQSIALMLPLSFWSIFYTRKKGIYLAFVIYLLFAWQISSYIGETAMYKIY